MHDLSDSVYNYPLISPAPSAIDGLSKTEATTAFVANIKRYIPSLIDSTWDCYYAEAYGDSTGNGGYRVFCYSSFHGIPYLVGNVFSCDVPNERADNVETVPSNSTYGWIQNNHQFHANISSPKELEVEIDDVPLLDFLQILKVLEQRVTDGYVHSLNEVRFGYMVFIDPQKKAKNLFSIQSGQQKELRQEI